ncbi:MAG TPA: hypothetical protein VFB37_09960 [Steroidobacteraceae bacterium]|nr:hypothetical protein [Steroidobacteraceae bacterium]
MSETRIYLVNDGHQQRLIRAPNAAQAIRYAAKDFTAEVASQDDLCTLLVKGTRVEESSANGHAEPKDA